MRDFNKYNQEVAYHWLQTDPSWRNSAYNAPLVARYTVLANCIPPTAQLILDVGCGDGYLLHLLCRRGFPNNIGIDNSPQGVRLAREQLSKCNMALSLVVGSAYDLPFNGDTFDAVVLADVIEHLETPEDCLEEISRVLKKDGTLAMSTPNKQPDRVWDKLHVQEFGPEELQHTLAARFSSSNLFGCWPMWWFERWERGGLWQRMLSALARFGFNPFEITTEKITLECGQLISVCQR
jgi:2-polyprenyl-3-methyl-5-hydroxy-6-metoxy-1,4-benzoquinol methylase